MLSRFIITHIIFILSISFFTARDINSNLSLFQPGVNFAHVASCGTTNQDWICKWAVSNRLLQLVGFTFKHLSQKCTIFLCLCAICAALYNFLWVALWANSVLQQLIHKNKWCLHIVHLMRSSSSPKVRTQTLADTVKCFIAPLSHRCGPFVVLKTSVLIHHFPRWRSRHISFRLVCQNWTTIQVVTWQRCIGPAEKTDAYLRCLCQCLPYGCKNDFLIRVVLSCVSMLRETASIES